jgi:hypothetical protein
MMRGSLPVGAFPALLMLSACAFSACNPALINVETPARCARAATPLGELPPKPRLPEVSAHAQNCVYALCLDSANYARLLERLRILEEDDNRLRELCSTELAADPRVLSVAAAPVGER